PDCVDPCRGHRVEVGRDDLGWREVAVLSRLKGSVRDAAHVKLLRPRKQELPARSEARIERRGSVRRELFPGWRARQRPPAHGRKLRLLSTAGGAVRAAFSPRREIRNGSPAPNGHALNTGSILDELHCARGGHEACQW